MMLGKYSFSRYLYLSRISARQQWIYRGEMATRALSTILFLGVFVALWSAAFGFSQQEKMVGYTLPQMLWYLAMTESVALSTSRIFLDISLFSFIAANPPPDQNDQKKQDQHEPQ